MGRPSFITTIKSAHHFTIQNMRVFLPLTLKTYAFMSFLMVVGIGMMVGVFSTDFLSSQKMITGAFVIGGFIILLQLTYCPLTVSLYRRALLNEEIEGGYLNRLLAPRQLKTFLVTFKVFIILLLPIILLMVGILPRFLLLDDPSFLNPFTLLKSFPLLIIGFFIGFLWYYLFMCARLSFTLPNVALDKGTHLSVSFKQTRSYVLFLLAIFSIVPLLLFLVLGVFQGLGHVLIGREIVEGPVAMIVSGFNFLLHMLINYYVILFEAGAVSFAYKSIVLEA